MARQKGIIKLKGTIGDITFYKTQDGHLAREKGGIDANRIEAIGYGSSKPIVEEVTDDHRQLNRRVEFEIFRN